MSITNQTCDSLSTLREQIDQFARDRDWEKFHSPKNLSMALTVEAAELMEIFQWEAPAADLTLLTERQKVAVEHEVADILIYLLRFCSATGIDPIAAAQAKLKLNAEKYPVSLAKGTSKKYTEYSE